MYIGTQHFGNSKTEMEFLDPHRAGGILLCTKELEGCKLL